jgi:hypothetical protein
MLVSALDFPLFWALATSRSRGLGAIGPEQGKESLAEETVTERQNHIGQEKAA